MFVDVDGFIERGAVDAENLVFKCGDECTPHIFYQNT